MTSPLSPTLWTFLPEEVYPELSLPSIVKRKITGLAKDLIFTLGALISRRTHSANYGEAIQEKEDSKALCVFLHGLNSHPSVMDGHRDVYEQNLPGMAFYQPFVTKNGNCKLEEAAESIYRVVKGWAQQNPDRPLVFCGISNGARLSAYIAAKLKLEDGIANPIKVSAIAGPLFGSKMINQPEFSSPIRKIWQIVIRLFNHCDDVMEEMAWGSKASKQLISSIHQAAEKGVSFDFYASPADFKVTDFTAALPRGVERAHYRVLDEEGHSSIIRAVIPLTLEKTRLFLS